MECKADDLGVDLPIALKRLVALKTGTIGGVTVSAMPSEHLEDLSNSLSTYRRNGNILDSDLDSAADGVQLLTDVWVITFSESLMQRPEFAGLKRFEDRFGGGGSPFMYAFSSASYYNVTFGCDSYSGKRLECEDAEAAEDAYYDDADEDPYNFYGIFTSANIQKCRKTPDPLPREVYELPQHLKCYENTNKEESLIDRQIDKAWPAHMETMMDAFWDLLTDPGKNLQGARAEEFYESEEDRNKRVRLAEANTLAFYRNIEINRQAFIRTRPQVR